MELPGTEIPALSNGGAAMRLEVPEGERARLLIVDDDAASLASLAGIVDDMALDVVTADSGRAALRALLNADFALILLDVHMPTLDGFETAQLIHGRPRSAQTPIIFVTADANSEADRFRGYSTGAVDWITAPIAVDILRAKVKVFVDLYYLNLIARQQAEQLQQRAEEITRKNLQLETASKIKSEFLASMSHELRTPLNAIIGFSEVLKDGLAGALSSQQQGYVTDIFDSGQHLLSLINDILDLSKIEAGQMTFEPEPMDVLAVLQDSLCILKEKAGKRHIRLELEQAEVEGNVLADLRKCKQILYNLLSNAVKFTPDNGAVRLQARRVRRADVRLEPPEAQASRLLPLPPGEFDDFLEVSVSDTGIGIAEPDLRRLFQAFLQLDSSLARTFEGTGLGLTLVRNMAALHGGTVGVISALGKGSRFVVWLPWRPVPVDPASDPAPASWATAPSPEPGADRQSVLLIEDDDQAAELLRLHLAGAGFQVERAADAETGLALAAQLQPALITLDLLLPGLSGWDALERLKADPQLARIPVVIVSVVANRQRGYALGAFKVLQKPLLKDELLAALRALGLARADHPCTILVVDDDPKAGRLISAHLRGANCTVLRAYGGREAIAKTARSRPDLVIFDLMMPDIDGFAVVEALKSRPESVHVPILILTAKQLTEQDRRRLTGFVTDILEKSQFDPGRLLAEVKRALGKTAIARGAADTISQED